MYFVIYLFLHYLSFCYRKEIGMNCAYAELKFPGWYLINMSAIFTPIPRMCSRLIYSHEWIILCCSKCLCHHCIMLNSSFHPVGSFVMCMWREQRISAILLYELCHKGMEGTSNWGIFFPFQKLVFCIMCARCLYSLWTVNNSFLSESLTGVNSHSSSV